MPESRTSDDAEASVAIHIDLPTILDDRSAILFRLRIDGVLNQAPKTLVLDCSEVRFVDSGGLRLLLEATRTGQDYGTHVVTYDPLGALRHLRSIMDLELNLNLAEGDVPPPAVDLRYSDPFKTSSTTYDAGPS
jgi:anti-anti-sigma regulatory factor